RSLTLVLDADLCATAAAAADDDGAAADDGAQADEAAAAAAARARSIDALVTLVAAFIRQLVQVHHLEALTLIKRGSAPAAAAAVVAANAQNAAAADAASPFIAATRCVPHLRSLDVHGFAPPAVGGAAPPRLPRLETLRVAGAGGAWRALPLQPTLRTLDVSM